MFYKLKNLYTFCTLIGNEKVFEIYVIISELQSIFVDEYPDNSDIYSFGIIKHYLEHFFSFFFFSLKKCFNSYTF